MLRKRPYLSEKICREVVAAPLRCETQDDGRVRYWGVVVLPERKEERILRVVTLDDGETLHNAFLDRGFREDEA